ncbi:hypothetical protein [Enterococcus sp. AZ109]|uniref:hypothetical protein n=1 Tax=Enterococcus sp. AZ109 TaxID=2774634 RepID=UPI003F1F0092
METINLEEYKKAWEPDSSHYRVPILFPKEKIVVRPFTEKEPPLADNIIIKGFDWNKDEYITEQVVPVELYEAQQAGFEELAMFVGQLAEKVYSEDMPPEEGGPEEPIPEEPIPADPEVTDPEVVDPETPGEPVDADPVDPEIPSDPIEVK